MARTRVVHLIPNLTVGGAERMLLHLVTHLSPRFEPIVVSLHRAGGSRVEHELASSGIEVVYLDKELGLDARMFTRISGTLRRLDPAILHTHRPVLHYALPSVLGRFRGRVVHTVHSIAQQEVRGTTRKVAHWVAYRAGVAPVAVCSLVAESIRQVYGIPARRVIPNGIPVRAYTLPPAVRDRWRSANGIPIDAMVFACVARLAPPKDVGALLGALATLRDGSAPLLLVAGEGPLRARLEAEAAAQGVEPRVRFLGARPDVAEILAAADAYVLPSLWEGNPLSVIEAMAAGRAVIATSVGGVPELVCDQETGLLVPPGDRSALAGAMRRLAREPALRERLGRNARRRAAEAFDAAQMAAAYERLYDEVLSGPPAGRR